MIFFLLSNQLNLHKNQLVFETINTNEAMKRKRKVKYPPIKLPTNKTMTQVEEDIIRKNEYIRKVRRGSLTREELELELKDKHKHFCREYCIDWNPVRAYRRAFKTPEHTSVAPSASMLLHNPMVKEYIKIIQADLEYLTGITKQRQVAEYAKIAYTSIAHLHDTWIELKEFEKLKEENPDALDAIQSVETKTSTMLQYVPELDRKAMMRVDYVKIKLHDKLKALEAINRIMGYNAPEKVEMVAQHTIDVEQMTEEEKQVILAVSRKKMKYGDGEV